MTTLIKNGTVVSATGSALMDVLVDGETIAAVLAPGSQLLGDVEAVAPRDGAGPLLPVLLTAVRELVETGRAALVCTTSHPERVTPELRTPGTLDHELAIPLPDRKQRLRLLADLREEEPPRGARRLLRSRLS